METNLSQVYKAIDIANEYGTTVILNTAPIRSIPDDIYKR